MAKHRASGIWEWGSEPGKESLGPVGFPVRTIQACTPVAHVSPPVPLTG